MNREIPKIPAFSPPEIIKSRAEKSGGDPVPGPDEDSLSSSLPTEKTIEEFQENCAAISAVLRRMNSTLSKLNGMAEKVASMKMNADDDMIHFELEQIKEEETRCRMQVFTSLDIIFRRLNKRAFSIFTDDILFPEESKIPYEDEIGIAVEENAIYVKTPHLFNRNKHWIRKDMVDYFEFFAPAVDRKMKRVIDKLPVFLKKNVDILSVYPEGSKYIPDADNIDTKKVIDAITRPLLGGDSGECCSFSCKVICSNRLPEGTYFSVTEGFARTPDLAESVKKLSNIFHNLQV